MNDHVCCGCHQKADMDAAYQRGQAEMRERLAKAADERMWLSLSSAEIRALPLQPEVQDEGGKR